MKLNISEHGKAWRLEVDSELLAGKSVGDIVDGNEVSSDLAGYQLEITGGSDFAGFPLKKDVEGIGVKRVMLDKGWGLRIRPKRNKKVSPKTTGLRMRKMVRGKVISEKVVQINMKVVKVGSKKLAEVFPEQNKAPEKKVESAAPAA